MRHEQVPPLSGSTSTRRPSILKRSDDEAGNPTATEPLGSVASEAADDVSIPMDGDAGVRVVRERARQRRIEKRNRRLTWVAGVATVVFVLAIGLLAVLGWRSTLQITGGNIDEITDPSAPGYSAAASTTDVQLLALIDDDGALAVSLMLIGGAGRDHVSVIPISSEMVVWDFEDAPPQATRVVYADAGMDVLLLRLGADLTVGIGNSAVLPMSALEPLFDRVGTVTLNLPDVVYHNEPDGTRTVQYPAGELTLEPDEFAEFLSYTDNNEGELNRSLRVNPLWEKIIAAYVDDPGSLGVAAEDAVDLSLWDEISSMDHPGHGEEGGVVVDMLPTEVIPMYVNPPASVSRVDQNAIAPWVTNNVPFPTSAFPGQRMTVSLLNGTNDEGSALKKVSPLIVSAGGSIGLTGNGASFDVATTTVEYVNDGNADGAGRIADQLGVVATRVDLLPSGVDVQVTVGEDQL